MQVGLVAVATASKITCPDAKVIAPCTCDAYGANVVMHAPSKPNEYAALHCAFKELDDAQVSDILDAYLNTAKVSPLRYLALDNNRLTKVPQQISRFTQLNYLLLNKNKIASLPEGSLKFGDDTVWHLALAENPLFGNVQPGAFVSGGFGFGSSVHLNHANMTRFESGVFEPLLKQLLPFGGYPAAYLNVAFSNYINLISYHQSSKMIINVLIQYIKIHSIARVTRVTWLGSSVTNGSYSTSSCTQDVRTELHLKKSMFKVSRAKKNVTQQLVICVINFYHSRFLFSKYQYKCYLANAQGSKQ